MRTAELIKHLTSTEHDRGSAAEAALEQLIAQAADGEDLEPGAAAAILDRAGCSAEEFANAIEHEVQRRAWEAEAATLPALEEKLAEVRAGLNAALEEHHRGLQAAHAAYSKAAAPLAAERDRLTAAIAVAEEAKARLEAEAIEDELGLDDDEQELGLDDDEQELDLDEEQIT